MKKKYSIGISFIIFICVCVCVCVLTILYHGKSQSTATPHPTITPTPIFTGVKEWKPSEDQQKQIEQAFTLRSKLPLQEEFFSLTFDYNKNMFVVTFTSTDPQNSEKFTTWRIQQGFGDIPESKFRYHSS
jgi:hypothetical protein